MQKSLFAACLAAALCLALPAHADRVAAGGNVKVAFSLASDTYELEYIHPGSDAVAATDNAFYRAAQFMLRMGHSDFQVETVKVFGLDMDVRPGAAQVAVCGDFGCAEGMDAARLERANLKPLLGQTLVSISLAAPHTATSGYAQRINSGRVIYAMEGSATYADSGSSTGR